MNACKYLLNESMLRKFSLVHLPSLPPEPVRRLGIEVPVGIGHRQDVPVEVVHEVGGLAPHRPGALHQLLDDPHDGGRRNPLSAKENLSLTFDDALTCRDPL